MNLKNIINSFNLFEKQFLTLENYLDEIEPIIDINLVLNKMDHNNALDIVLPRLHEFEYESKGVKYKIETNLKISDLKINNEDGCRYIKLNTLYKTRTYCDIIKDLTVRNSITHENINYEIIHRNKEIRNKYNNLKNIPICYFISNEEIFIKLIDNVKVGQSINIKFYGIVLRNTEKCRIMYMEFKNKDGYIFNN